MPRPSNLRRRPVPSNLPSEAGSIIYCFMNYFLEESFVPRTAVFGYNGRAWSLIVDNPITEPGFNAQRTKYAGGYHWIENVADDSAVISSVWRSIDAITWELSLRIEEELVEEFIPNLVEVSFRRNNEFYGVISDGGSGDRFGTRFYVGNGNQEEWNLTSFVNFDPNLGELVGEFPSSSISHGLESLEDLVILADFENDSGVGFSGFIPTLIVSNDGGQNFILYRPFPEGTWLAGNLTGESAAGYRPGYPFRFLSNGTLLWLIATKDITEQPGRINIGRSSSPIDPNSWEFETIAEYENFGRNSAGLFSFTPVGSKIFVTFGDTEFPDGTPAYRHLFYLSGGQWSELDLNEILGPLTGDFTLDIHIDGIWYDDPTDHLYILTNGTPNDSFGSSKVFNCKGSSGNWVDITPNWTDLLNQNVDGAVLPWGFQTIWGAPAASQGNVNRPPST